MFKFITGMVVGSLATIFTLALVSANDKCVEENYEEDLWEEEIVDLK